MAYLANPTYLTGTTTSCTFSPALSMDSLQDFYYFEQAPHPLIPVLEQDYQKIQHILDSKESIVL